MSIPNKIVASLPQHPNRHLSVHMQLPTLAELLISLISVFVLNVNEQPKSIRQLRKAIHVKQTSNQNDKKNGKKRCPTRLDSRMNHWGIPGIPIVRTLHFDSQGPVFDL